MSTADAPSPEYHPSYSSPDGDIVLRSDDGVLFRVQSSVLIGGSGFFREMLEIPRDKEEKENNEPIVMQETNDVLLTILDVINPMGDLPALKSVDFAHALLTAAEKLDAPKVTSYVRLAIMNPSFLETPLDVYLLGCQNRWEEVAQVASTGTLKYDLSEPIHRAKLEKLHTRDLMNLQGLHFRRKRGMIDALNPHSGSTPKMFWAKVTSSYGCGYHSRENHLCGPWTQLKFHIAESMESQPSGDWLRPHSFIEKPEFKDLWSYRCNTDDSCSNGAYFGKSEVHAELIRILDLLPTCI